MALALEVDEVVVVDVGDVRRGVADVVDVDGTLGSLGQPIARVMSARTDGRIEVFGWHS